MPQSELESWLQSPICEVVFAGFISDTYTLQRNGWQISARQSNSSYRSNFCIQLILKHDASNLYAMTNEVELDIGMLSYGMHKISKHLVFNIQRVSSKMIVEAYDYHNTGSVSSFLNSFEPISCKPSLTREAVDFDTLKIFKPLVETKEIILGPKTVEEALEYILKLQEPEQIAIMEERRLEAARQRVRDTFTDVTTQPQYTTHAQIISIA